MNDTQKNRPIRLNLDKSRKQLSEEEAFYLLNHERGASIHSGDGGNFGKTMPILSSEPLCEIDQPDGYNYSVGSYRSEISRELYFWVLNENGDNYIQRVNPSGSCQIVYDRPCLQLSAHPSHSIEQFRAYLKVERNCAGRHGKYLIWVDGNNDNAFCLDVEASIATNSFTTDFFSRCPTDCAELYLAVPKTCGCITGEFIPLSTEAAALTNHIVDHGFKFAFRQYYYDNRVSDVSDISKLFYQNKGGCFARQAGLSRCIKLNIPLGNPLVDRIDILFSTDNGANWQISDTVYKYASYSSTARYWYERELNPDLDIAEDECSFYYNFCNDKQCEAVSPEDMSRVFNPMPLKAQGLIPIKNLLGFYNYEQGNCPLDRNQISKMTIAETAGGTPASCEIELVSVKVRAVIHNNRNNINGYIFRLNGTVGGADDPADKAFFGGASTVGLIASYDHWSQNFEGKYRNFVAYIEGTDYFAEMKQWKCLNGFRNNEEIGTIPFPVDAPNIIVGEKGWYYQECEFKIPKGTKGFIRLQSHKQSHHNPDTSTTVEGLVNISEYNSRISIGSHLVEENDFRVKEIYFDTCDGPVELQNMFVVEDLIIGRTDHVAAFAGYVTDNSNVPVEGVEVYMEDDATNPVAVTDFNGFYYWIRNYDGGIDSSHYFTTTFKGELDCSNFSIISTSNLRFVQGQIADQDVKITNEVYNSNFTSKVIVAIKDCDGNPVSGVVVSSSGSKFKVSDSLGNVTFKFRNYTSRNRLVRLVVMDRAGCFTVACNGECAQCLPQQILELVSCLNDTIDRNLDFTLNVNGPDDFNGLKRGGLYQWAFVMEGEYGRISSAYELNSLQIPKLQEGSEVSTSTFRYNGTGMVLPSWVKCIKILRSENLNPFVIQWVVDKIERTRDGKVKITIQSLNDYNSSYFSKTNTGYKWLDGDRVEFISNGDGSLFGIQENGLLNYQTLSPFSTSDTSKDAPADFFNQIIISDDGKLDKLKEGAVIEIQRAKYCKDEEPTFFSICVSIAVENGVLVEPISTFQTFDTFIVPRIIGSAASIKFESKWPSDFWITNDSGYSDTGKAYFVNRFENSKRYGRSVTFNSASSTNYFGGLVKTFDNPDQGDIIGMGIKDGIVVMAICENDSIVVQAADDLLRTGGDGTIRALPPDAILSDSQPKLKGVFGCQYDSVGSIFFGDGFATWVDVNRDAFVKHDYNEAKDVSENQMKLYFARKMQEIKAYNLIDLGPLEKFRFCTAINEMSGKVMLTIKKMVDGSINNSQAPFNSNETIVFDPNFDDFTTFLSHTPERYGQAEISDQYGCAFISIVNGVPHVHPVKPFSENPFNNFYGISVDRVIGVVINRSIEKVKSAISLEIQDEMMWFVKEVRTDKSAFLSEIPPIRMVYEEGHWRSSFLSNLDSRSGLYGKDRPRGYAISVLLIRDNTDNLKYGTFDDIKRTKYDELDLITFKFSISEQSGFSNNI